MEEQPVALATTRRLPKSWESIFYIRGVSPQPAQAPENSNSGRSTCMERMLSVLTLVRSTSGRLRKNSMWLLPCRESSLLAGQTSAQSVQPVQSFGEIWMTNFSPFQSGCLASRHSNPSGAFARASGEKNLLRITACGQTAVHLPHWMQRVGSHSGRSRARLRFSYWDVPFGNVRPRAFG